MKPRLLFAVLLIFFGIVSTHAAPPPPLCTWTGGGSDSNWSTAANWDNCGGAHPVPIDGDWLLFPDLASRKTNTNDIAGLDLGHLQFNGYDYVIGGNAITLSAGISSNLASQSAGTTAPFFNVNITLMGPQTFAGNGISQGVFLHGTLALNGNTLTVTGVGPTGLDGDISGAGGITTDSFELFLAGNNSYTGPTNVNGGAVQVGSNTAFGTTGVGTVVAPGARLLLNGTSPMTINEPLALGGIPASEIAMNAFQVTHTWAGPITLNGATNFRNDLDASPLVFSGVISGPGGITRTGIGGVVVLSGPNTYSGTTTAQDHTLLINGTQPGSAVFVTGGTLGGIGTVGALTATSGSVAPGQSPGILNSGTVSWNPATTFAVEINNTTVGTGYDQLNVAGTVSLGSATLSVALGAYQPFGSTFIIINNDGADPIAGTFAGLPPGSTITTGGQNFTISYTGGTGNDVVLTAAAAGVPAMPTALLLMLAIALMALAVVMHRHRARAAPGV